MSATIIRCRFLFTRSTSADEWEMLEETANLQRDEEILTLGDLQNISTGLGAVGPDTPVVLQKISLSLKVHLLVPTIEQITAENPQVVVLKHEDLPGLSNFSLIRKRKYEPCLSGCHPHPLYVGCGVEWLGRGTKRGWMSRSVKTFRFRRHFLSSSDFSRMARPVPPKLLAECHRSHLRPALLGRLGAP